MYIFYSLEYFKVLPKGFLFIDSCFSLNIFQGVHMTYGMLKMKFINSECATLKYDFLKVKKKSFKSILNN